MVISIHTWIHYPRKYHIIVPSTLEPCTVIYDHTISLWHLLWIIYLWRYGFIVLSPLESVINWNIILFYYLQFICGQTYHWTIYTWTYYLRSFYIIVEQCIIHIKNYIDIICIDWYKKCVWKAMNRTCQYESTVANLKGIIILKYVLNLSANFYVIQRFVFNVMCIVYIYRRTKVQNRP